MKPAQQLLNAIQSLQVSRLEAVVNQITTQHERAKAHAKGNPNWKAETPLNDRLDGDIDATALHVLAKAYEAHHGTPLAQVFNDMMAIMLANGANPFLEVGRKIHINYRECQRVVTIEQGKTVAELCGRHMPKALTDWLAGKDFFDGYNEDVRSTTADWKVVDMQAFRDKKEITSVLDAMERAKEIAKRA